MLDHTKFEQFFLESFCDDRSMRELRLSFSELSYIKNSYPSASCTKQSDAQPDGKAWYLVTLEHMISPVYCKA